MSANHFSSEGLWKEEDYIPMDLHTAANIGCEDRVRDIIEKSSSKSVVNQPNRSGWTPLMYASYSGDHRVVRYLLEEGASHCMINNRGFTPLMLAAKCGNTDSASLLIEVGAVVDTTDAQNWSALFYAASTGHRSIVQLLAENDSCLNMVDKDGMSPLMLAAEAGHEMIVKDLLQYGATVSVISKSGETAVSLAVRNGHSKVKNAIDTHLFLQKNYTSEVPKNKGLKSTDLYTLLATIGLSKYYRNFERHYIDLSVFWTLTDCDLKEIGIDLLGPRKKITSLISRLGQNKGIVANPEGQVLVVQLLEDRKKLQQKISELHMLLSREGNLREVAELRLAETVEVLKHFTDIVKKTAVHMSHSEECLRNAICSLRQTFLGTDMQGTSGDQWSFQKTLTILSNASAYLDSMDSLIDDISKKTKTLF